jgi:hypothetical protein
MADADNNQSEASGGDRRGDSRRRADRRRQDRRLPVAWWRKPWALVGMGAIAMLLVVAIASAGRGRDELPRTDERLLVDTAPAEAEVPVVATVDPRPVQTATSGADFERLMAEGEAAVGRRVRVELFCNTIDQASVRNVENIHPSLEALTDTATRKVPVAECKWGRAREVRRDDLLLVVPPEMADQFARRPLVDDRFVRRRQVRAEIEWLGRADALALRPAGVLRDLY